MILALLLNAGAQAPTAPPIAAGEPLSQNWRTVLHDGGPQANALALRLAHTGLPAGSDWAGLKAADAHLRALLAAASLAPARLTGRPALDEVTRAAAVAVIVEHLLHSDQVDEVDVLAERVRPWLRSRELAAIEESLERAGPLARARALSLLEAAPYREARAALLRLALAEGTAARAEERAAAAERVFLADGRPAFASLGPLFEPEAPDLVLRRLLDAWERCYESEDWRRLEQLATLPGPAGETALLLWARHETDPERRLTLFGRALNGDPDRRDTLLEALTRAGPDPGLAAALLALVDMPALDLRQLALRLLPRVATPEALFAAYAERAATLDPARRGPWMVELARLPVPQGQRLAADWLADLGGYANGPAIAVARALRDSPEVDAVLDRLFRAGTAGDEVLVPLALGRAGFVEVARRYLRQLLERASTPRRGEAIRALAEYGEARDIGLLLELARDPAYSAPARASAILGLAASPQHAELLLELLEPPPDEYEVAEILVRALVSSPQPELRRHGLAAAESGLGRTSSEERDALRLAAWQEQAEQPSASEVGELASGLEKELQACRRRPGPAPQVPLPDPFELARDYPLVHECARALAAALPGSQANEQVLNLVSMDLEGVPPGAVWLSAAQLASAHPRLASVWCHWLAAVPEVAAATRVRALATAFRGGDGAVLDALLLRPGELLDHPWDLAHGIGRPAARAWVLPVDRLCDMWLLAEVPRRPAEERLAWLATLGDATSTAGTLAEAAELALDCPQGAETAVVLAAAAVDTAPHEARARLLLGEALRACGRLQEARQAFQAAARLAEEGSEVRWAALHALHD